MINNRSALHLCHLRSAGTSTDQLGGKSWRARRWNRSLPQPVSCHTEQEPCLIQNQEFQHRPVLLRTFSPSMML